MLLAPRPDTTTADLLRLLAFWLMLVLAAQGVAAAWALAQGPLHRHREGAAVAAVVHDRGHLPHRHGQHAAGQRHHHAWDDRSVQIERGPADIDSAAFALTAALSLLALAAAGLWRGGGEARRHVRRAVEPRQATSVDLPFWLRPPRRA